MDVDPQHRPRYANEPEITRKDIYDDFKLKQKTRLVSIVYAKRFHG